MRREAQGLPGAVRLGAGGIAIALASVLLAACTGTDGGPIAEGSRTTTLKQPVKVSTAKARPARSDVRADVRAEARGPTRSCRPAAP